MRPSQHSPRARQMHERLRVIWQWQLTDIPETVNRLDMTTTAQTIQQVSLTILADRPKPAPKYYRSAC